MKKWLPLLFLSLFIKVAAYANCACPNYGIPYPAVYQTCYNTYGFVDFLYWKAHEDGIAWAASQTAFLSDPTLAVPRTTAEPDFRWKPGFRVGLGHQLGCDGWDLSLAYTWYRSQAKSSKTFNPRLPVAFSLFDTNGTAGGHAKWRLHYHTLELALKQPFFIGKCAILSPSLSLFAAYTSEKYDIENFLPTENFPLVSNNTVSNKQRFSCIGPKAGFNSSWNLTNCLSIFGEGSIAFLYGHYHISRLDQHFDAEFRTTTALADLKNEFNTLRLVPFYSIGVNWAQPVCMCNNNYLVYFKAAWEQQVWLQHNQFFLLSVANDNTLTFNNTNLSICGLTLRGGIQF